MSDAGKQFLTLVIPKSWKFTILVEAHDKLGHQGNNCMYCLIKHQYYWHPPLDIIATPGIHTMIDPGSVAPDLTLITTDIGVVATRTHVEVAPCHSTDLPTIVSHVTGAPLPTATATTHHTADLHLIGILPKMTADLDINPKSNTTDQPADPRPPHKHHHGNIRIGDTNKSPLMTHHQNTTAQMIMTVTQRMI